MSLLSLAPHYMPLGQQLLATYRVPLETEVLIGPQPMTLQTHLLIISSVMEIAPCKLGTAIQPSLLQNRSKPGPWGIVHLQGVGFNLLPDITVLEKITPPLDSFAPEEIKKVKESLYFTQWSTSHVSVGYSFHSLFSIP